MKVLGIESSCDETGVAIYDPAAGLLADVLHTQVEIHAPFGGVVPELASRDHLRRLLPLTKAVLAQAKLEPRDIDGVAYTKGPGLVGALLVGALFGRTLAMAWKKPAIGVHHLEGHLLAPFLGEPKPTFPFLALLVSGGHTELIAVNAIGSYTILGETVDDAVGEAFDKTAKLLGLGYPGGARLAQCASQGNPDRFHFPRPMLDRPGLMFSFSGLKTAAAQVIRAQTLDEATVADIACAFQTAVVETLTVKCRRALQQTALPTLVIAGGVSANAALRESLTTMCTRQGVSLFFPPLAFCTDNGAMIAYAGCQRLMMGQHDGLAVEVQPRWGLNELKRFTPFECKLFQ